MNIKNRWEKLHSDPYHKPKYPSFDFVQFAFKNYDKKDKILDLGCGNGRHLKFLAENDFDAFGCDFSKNAIQHADMFLKQYGLSAHLDVASFDNLPYEDDFFDGIVAYGVILYGTKEQIEKGALEIHRVLKKNGKAYLKVRNLYDSRYINGIKYNNGGGDKYEIIVNDNNINKPAFHENGMKTYHFDKKEIKRIYAIFSKIEINRMRHTFDNDTYADDSFIVILTK
ncbi:class I SAM-dependent methyltransferase [Campylobacter lari]|nr:class I SAM-dependent methyltransferase [Campylobacter lari]